MVVIILLLILLTLLFGGAAVLGFLKWALIIAAGIALVVVVVAALQVILTGTAQVVVEAGRGIAFVALHPLRTIRDLLKLVFGILIWPYIAIRFTLNQVRTVSGLSAKIGESIALLLLLLIGAGWIAGLAALGFLLFK